MKDAAAKIAATEYSNIWPTEQAALARKINTAIRRAVKAERERCCGIVQRECNKDAAWNGRYAATRKIVSAINTPAKKRPSKRKGRRWHE
jgi:hypothetical protein